MPVMPVIKVLILSTLGILSSVKAEPAYLVDHIDLIAIDPQLSLSDLVNKTLQQYPDYKLIAAMHQESEALNERGSRWVAGAPNVSLYYKDDFAGSDIGAYEFEGSVQVPIWNWGQRDAGLRLAEYSEQSIAYQVKSMELKVAGLVRKALWQMKLEQLRYGIAQKSYHLAEQLSVTVQRRVQLGDLPRTDFLLAQSEVLQKKTDLIYAEAELMHARKKFSFLVQDNKIPAQINETQSTLMKISDTHPDLAGISAVITQKKAKIAWLKAKGSGQTNIAIGGNKERDSRTDSSVDSIVFSLSVPFGGQAYSAPKVAAANKAFVQAEMEKAHLYRALLAEVHEAEHELEIERAAQEIAIQMQANAQEQLKMANLSFSEGEINLMDFLKIQARSLRAISNAQESAIRLQRDIAFYNQAVGVIP